MYIVDAFWSIIPGNEAKAYAALGALAAQVEKEQPDTWMYLIHTPNLDPGVNTFPMPGPEQVGFVEGYKDRDAYETTAPVGKFPAGASKFGMMDMQRNVWEWTASTYCPYDRPGCADARKVHRGRSWDDYLPGRGTGPDRWGSPPTNRISTLGFRCARS